MAVDHLNKLSVDSVREAYVIFKGRADLFQVKAVHIVYVDDGMRITHGNCGHVIFFSVDGDGSVDHLLGFGNHRDLFCSEDRGAHVDFYHGGLAVADSKIHIFDTASCGDA